MSDYQQFLASKSPAAPPSGLRDIPTLPAALKPFQHAITAWALRRGRAAMFEGTGLGKTLQQLAWADAVVREEDARVLVLTPLAVAEQTVAEAAKFGIPSVAYAADRHVAKTDIVVTNYERFEKFDISQFAGIVLDESGIIKNQDGKTRAMLTEACADTPWRLCCTATPAPNDYAELGQHAEFLGVMTAKEMLSMFFVHDGSIRANDHSQGADGWRLKRHAERDFWRWLASWSVMVRHPADLGFDEPGYDLPALNMHQVTVAAEYKPTAGLLFPVAASSLGERIGVRKDTAAARVAAAVKIIDSSWQRNVLSAPCFQMKPRPDDAPKRGSDTQLTQRGSEPSKTPPSKAADPRLAEPISEPTTQLTKRSSALAHKSSAIATMPPAEHATLPTENTETYLSAALAKCRAGPRTNDATDDTSKISASMLPSMTGCSPGKGVGAPSADNLMRTSGAAGSPSIIAMQPEPSGGCFVPDAITASVAIKTIQNVSDVPLIISTAPDESAWVVWCNLNKEQEAIASVLGDKCFSVYGALPSDQKVDRIFRWIRGERPVLLSKPSICGHGLNLQRCHNMIFVGLTDSFEQVYQAIRRCWRFGQARPVDVYFVASELEGAVVANLRRKEEAFDKMLDAMGSHMRDLMRDQVLRGRNASADYNPIMPMEIPTWL